MLLVYIDTVKRTTPKVATETVKKTGNSTKPPEEPTTTIGTSKVKTTKKLPNETTVSTSETAAVSETSTTANVRNVQETTAVKTTPISSATTDIRTMTTGLAKHATVSEGITLVPEITEATTESSQAKTESGTQVKEVTVAHTLESATTVIGVTQEPATQINSESATVNVRTMTTEQAKLATVHNDLETPEVTTKSSMAKSTTIISKAVTIDHTLDGSTTVIRVMQESTKQADPGTASTAHSTFKSNTAQSSNAPTIASESGTRTSTKVINKPEVITSKITSTQGSSSVINSESATVDIRTITTGTLPEDFTSVQETTKPVTMAPTLEGPTTVIRVTKLDASTASTTHTTLKSNTAQSSNLTTRETESGTSTSTAVMNEPEAIRTKTTPVEYTNSVFKSTTEGTRTTTTGLVKSATVPKASTLVIETSRVTMEPPLDQTATVTSKPVTVAHALSPNTVIIATQTDLSSASTTHTTLKESNTPNAPGTSSATTVMNEQQTSTTKTSAQGSSSVINSESATVDIRTTATNTLPEDLTLVAETPEFTSESSQAKTESITLVSMMPVTVAHTLDGSTTVIRVTQEPLTQAEAGTASTTHTTLKKSNIDDSTNATTSFTGSSTTTTFINEPEITATKTTLAQDSNSVINSATAEARTTTTAGLAKLATVPEALTLVLQTFNVTIEPSPPKTKSTTQDVDADIASTAHSTFKEGSSTAKTNVPNTANAQGTAATVINYQVTSTTKITSSEGLVSLIKSTTGVTKTTTTGSTKLVTESKSSTLVPQTSGVTMAPSPATTQSAIVTSKPVTEAQTFEGPTSAIRVTQDDGSTSLSAHTTLEKSNTSSNAHNTVNAPGTGTQTTAINLPETSTTKTTSPEGSSSVIKSTIGVTKTTTTGSTKLATESKSSTLVPQTSRVTMEPLPAKTQSAIVTSKPVTEAQTFEGPTSAIRVTQEHGAQDDASTALSEHTTMEKSNTSSNAHNTVSAPGTSTATTAINQPEASTTKTTSPKGSSSVIKSTTELTKSTTTVSIKLATESKSSTLVPQTSGVTIEPSPAKTQSVIVTSKPVTEAQTFEGPTSAIRVTKDDASTALSARTTMEKSNTSSNAPNTVNPPETSNATTPINRPEASTTKTTPTKGSSSINKSSTEVTKTTGLAKNATESKGSTLVPTEPSPAKTQSTAQVSIMPITVAHTLEGPITNTTTTAPPVGLPTVLKFASPTSQTLKSTENSTTNTRTTTLSPTIKSTNASRNASVAHSTPAPPHRHEPTSLKPPTSTAAISVATELPTHRPVLNEGSIDLRFSLNETFIIVYSDRTTADFLFLATKVVIAINKMYRGEYKEFKRSRVNSFSKGSIKVDMTLVFENTSVVPSTDNVEIVLFNAVTINGNRLNIINETIKAVPTKTDALTTINQANVATVQQTTVKTNTGYTNTSSASAWILHFSILTATAIITVFVTRAVV
ncbi:mucin-2 isoform X3 [Triplophysa dalaica]|uniref:mucin-2 isoform X3 n=1 Tax=Triplophysa dalaica TaxID=1582913 RepID=UPI0024DF313F|nr:mucin-2 isoform X3 [Triplophysa dalaica]